MKFKNFSLKDIGLSLWQIMKIYILYLENNEKIYYIYI